jgi:hypothetical protein
MTGPIGSPYPGTPIVLAFLGFLAAAYCSRVVSARKRRTGVIGQWDWIAGATEVFMAVLFVLVVAWVMWAHRQ